MKTFLKDEQIQLGTLKKSLKIIRRKLIISNSNKTTSTKWFEIVTDCACWFFKSKNRLKISKKQIKPSNKSANQKLALHWNQEGETTSQWNSININFYHLSQP